MHENRSLDSVAHLLREPFPLSAYEARPGGRGTRALVLLYVDSREYQRRLDDVLGLGAWSTEVKQLHTQHPSLSVVLRVRFGGVEIVRENVGEELDAENASPVCSAFAQSFKRACADLGVGRHLYEIPPVWADVADKKFADPKRAIEDALRAGGFLPEQRLLRAIKGARDQRELEQAKDLLSLARRVGDLSEAHVKQLGAEYKARAVALGVPQSPSKARETASPAPSPVEAAPAPEEPAPAREHSPNSHDLPAPEWPRGEPWKSGGREGGDALSAQRVRERHDDGSDRLHQRGQAVAESTSEQRKRVAQAEIYAALVSRIDKAITLDEQDATRTAIDDGIRAESIDAKAHESLVALFAIKFPEWDDPHNRAREARKEAKARATATSNKVARNEAKPEDFGPPSLPAKAPTPTARVERSTDEMSAAGKAALAKAKFTGPGGVKLPNPYAEKAPAAPKPRIAAPLVLSGPERELERAIKEAFKPSELYAATEKIAHLSSQVRAYFEQLADDAQERITSAQRKAEADGQQGLDLPPF